MKRNNSVDEAKIELVKLEKQKKKSCEKQITIFEKFADGSITQEEYLKEKAMLLKQNEKENLNKEKSEKKLFEYAEKDKQYKEFGKYATITTLSRKLIVQLIKEILIRSDNTLEIVLNFKESNHSNTIEYKLI